MTDARPYGVLGRVLGHSYTPQIYRMLADIDYRKFEREPSELEGFLRGGEWEGVNVTIPYKRAVLPYLDELSDTARRLGNVNTITRLPSGGLRGDNTDYYGFKVLAQSVGVELAGKCALVFGGDGGAGSTCMQVLADLGMDARAVGRSGKITYDDLGAWSHAALVVNCTPVGMYPACPDSVCSLDALTELEAVIDIVYNPARTGLMLQAEQRGIPAAGGLLMLVAQAAQAVERYTGQAISLERIHEVTAELSRANENIALIGMPGSGKTRVGERLSEIVGREHVDIDHELERRLGRPCADFIVEHGEDEFRREETRALKDIAARSGLVISCGGGIVTRPQNFDLLHQNSTIVMLDRPLDELSRKNRPITARDGVQKLADERMPLYRSWSDIIVRSRESAAATAREVARVLGFDID